LWLSLRWQQGSTSTGITNTNTTMFVSTATAAAAGTGTAAGAGTGAGLAWVRVQAQVQVQAWVPVMVLARTLVQAWVQVLVLGQGQTLERHHLPCVLLLQVFGRGKQALLQLASRSAIHPLIVLNHQPTHQPRQPSRLAQALKTQNAQASSSRCCCILRAHKFSCISDTATASFTQPYPVILRTCRHWVSWDRSGTYRTVWELIGCCSLDAAMVFRQPS
jgi:hypothetical protein